MAPTKPLTALDLCDRCGAQAYVRVLLTNGGELLFCAHHGREHSAALAKVAVDIQDESNRLSAGTGAAELGFSAERPPYVESRAHIVGAAFAVPGPMPLSPSRSRARVS